MTNTNPSNYDTNGLFGKGMSVSVVAYNAYNDMLALTGQFDSLSQSYYNMSTINLSMTLYNVSSLQKMLNSSISTFTNMSFMDVCSLLDCTNILDSLTIGNIENNNGNIFMLLNSSSNF